MKKVVLLILFTFFLLVGCSHSINNQITEIGPRPPLYAIRYNIKPNLYYIYQGEKVQNVGKLVTTIHNGGQRDGWSTSNRSDSFEIREIPGIDIDKAVAVKSDNGYIKVVAMTQQSYEKKYFPNLKERNTNLTK